MTNDLLVTATNASTGFYITIILTISLILILLVLCGHYILKTNSSISIGSFKIDASKKESVKEPNNKKEKEIHDAKKSVEDYTRNILSKQFDQVIPFLSSLRPIFNRLCYSILNDAMTESLGIEKEIRIKRKKHTMQRKKSH